jgi:hypothetical protein
VDEFLALTKAKVIDPAIDGIRVNDPDQKTFVYNQQFASLPAVDQKALRDAGFDGNYYTGKNIQTRINTLRKAASKSYQDGGGRMFNSFEVPVPFVALSKVQQDILQKQLNSKVGDVDAGTIDPQSARIEMDFTKDLTTNGPGNTNVTINSTGTPKYVVTVKHGTGKTTKTEPFDVTDLVIADRKNGVGSLFPQSDVSLIWGLSLAKDGATPFSKKDNYKDALRTMSGNYPYQISTINNNLSGTTGLKVKIILPVGGGKTQEVNVINVKDHSQTFPSSVEVVQKYLDDFLSTPELKARFYKEHGLTLN